MEIIKEGNSLTGIVVKKVGNSSYNVSLVGVFL